MVSRDPFQPFDDFQSGLGSESFRVDMKSVEVPSVVASLVFFRR